MHRCGVLQQSGVKDVRFQRQVSSSVKLGSFEGKEEDAEQKQFEECVFLSSSGETHCTGITSKDKRDNNVHQGVSWTFLGFFREEGKLAKVADSNMSKSERVHECEG